MKRKYLQSILMGLTAVLFISAGFNTAPVVFTQSLQNWSDPINLSNSGSSTDPIMVVDSNGMIHVVWVDAVDGYQYVQSTDGKVWTSPTTANFPFSPIDDSRPAFFANPNGIIYVIWQDQDNALYFGQTQSILLSNSASWSKLSKITDSVVNYDAVVDSQGLLHLSYVKNLDNDSTPAGVYYSRLDASSGSLRTTNIYTSKYFRSSDSTSAHVRIDVSDQDALHNVYIVWDDRSQKRIFMAQSPDGGESWEDVSQIRGPDEFTGYQTPYNVEVHAFGSTAFVLWQVGESSNQCVQYGQLIMHDAGDLGEPIKILDEHVGCPQKIEIFTLDQELSLLLLNIQGGLFLIAWNGNEWSDLQLQNQLLELFNPSTLDSILLGCQQTSLHANVLYVVGCDQGSSGDIWFTTRSLGSREDWYPSLSSWKPMGLLTSTEHVISSLSSVTYLNTVHLFWVQSARSGLDSYPSSIQYSSWSGEDWVDPRAIISNLTAKPLDISVSKDWEGRLFLVWVDGEEGNLYFSWADSEGAGLPSEWIQPKTVPSISQLSRSPDIVVDASGRIVIAYAIPVNEGRGIYIVQSTDLGNSWSLPVRVYDAVSAGWEMIDNPQIGLDRDGRLHMLFNRYSMRSDEQSMGLFYVQSIDGGVTWSKAELVREGLISWSDIYSYDQQTVHLIWQEKNGSQDSFLDQISLDGGLTWEVAMKIVDADQNTTRVSLEPDQAGGLRLAQFSYGEETLLQDWTWDGSHWILEEARELDLKGDGTRYAITYGVTSGGNLVVLVMFEDSDLTGKKRDEIWGLYRLLDMSESTQTSFLPIIPTPGSALITNEESNSIATPIASASPFPLAALDGTSSPDRKNFVGFFLVGIVLVVAVLVVWPKRKKR